MGNISSYKTQIDSVDYTKEAHQVIKETRKKYLSSYTKAKIDTDTMENNYSLQDNVDNYTSCIGASIKGVDMSVMQTNVELNVAGINTMVNKRLYCGAYSNLLEKSRFHKLKPLAHFIKLSKRGIVDAEDKKKKDIQLEKYKYPFENLVFEGGGSKGLAYCGAIKRLEELGIMKQIKRLAGTSAGAMTAALLAVGYDSHDLEKFFKLNLNKLLLDHKWGIFSLIPNLLWSYGWNPGNRIYYWFGEKIKEKTGNMDSTFKEVYERFDRELCIVVTNVNQMTPIYCHPKTTPDMPIRLAVRMSLSIPGLFEAVEHTLYGNKDIFVDGGVLCNYPIHCFDGWWLSMKKEDNFLERLHSVDDIPRLLDIAERFGQYNDKTLGMQVYSDDETELLKYEFEHYRQGVQLQDLPKTKLAKAKELSKKNDRENILLVQAVDAFLTSLREHNTDNSNVISRSEFLAAITDETLFPHMDKKILFGDMESEDISKCLDRDPDGKIKYSEILRFMEESGINIQYRCQGYERRNIENFHTFMLSLYETLVTNVDRVYIEEKDFNRTVGINTGYIGTTDFDLEPGDVKFLCDRGRISLEAFLKSYVALDDERKISEGNLLYSDGVVSAQLTSPSDPCNQHIDQMLTSGDHVIDRHNMNDLITI